MIEPFTFGIPLVARTSTRNWPLVERLLDLTLMSVRAQTDSRFRVVIAGHDRPTASAGAAFDFIEATWTAAPVRSDNLDSGRKKHAISQDVLARGGGLLMFLDADDWVDRRLIEVARETLAPHHVGGVITTGYATDVRSLRTMPIPHPGVFDQDFHRLCGSSIVARLDVSSPHAIRRDPFTTLHEHYRWIEVCREHGLAWQSLNVRGHYVVNTSVNHSEEHGPFAPWRRDLARGVARDGHEATDAFLAGFGLDRERARALAPALGGA